MISPFASATPTARLFSTMMERTRAFGRSSAPAAPAASSSRRSGAGSAAHESRRRTSRAARLPVTPDEHERRSRFVRRQSAGKHLKRQRRLQRIAFEPAIQKSGRAQMAEVFKPFPVGIGELQPVRDGREVGLMARRDERIESSIPKPAQPPRPSEGLSTKRRIGQPAAAIRREQRVGQGTRGELDVLPAGPQRDEIPVALVVAQAMPAQMKVSQHSQIQSAGALRQGRAKSQPQFHRLRPSAKMLAALHHKDSGVAARDRTPQPVRRCSRR